jgi:glyoxylase-like metal-dependent hydrolase (beta-lactamase superfamily II)
MNSNSTSDPQSRTGISRRGFLATAGAIAAATWLAPTRLLAAEGGIVEEIKQAAATNEIVVQPLRGNISAIIGSGGNIAVLPGPDGMLLIDAGIAVSQAKIASALKNISADPIRTLVNTHWHFDHTDGNKWLHDAGASIIAHENTRKRLAVRHRVQGWRFTFPPAPKGALPTTLFNKDLTLDLNGMTIHLNYYEPAHTDSDISVHFPDADVFHTGDTWWNGIYPFIDYSSGGNIDGTIAAAEANLAKVSDSTIVVPGHGPVGNKAEMIAFRDMLVAIREKVAALKEAGKTLAQTQAAKPTADFDEKWGKFVITPDAFTELVYQGV